MRIRFDIERRDILDDIQDTDSVLYGHGRGIIEVESGTFSDDILDIEEVEVIDDTEYSSTEDEVTMVRCQGETEDGTRCERTVDISDGSDPYCYQHISQS